VGTRTLSVSLHLTWPHLMPLLTDIASIRSALRRDPIWSAYALCDLDPSLFPSTRWFGPGLTLVLHAHGTCILFAIDARSLVEAMAEATWPFHVQARDDVFEEVRKRARIEHHRPMWRMWRARNSSPAVDSRAVALGSNDVPALRALYADGELTGESPDFFMPSTVADGSYFGIYEDGRLTAAAGTHVLSRREGAAAIGNVYTRRDRRGRGLARAVVQAVLQSLADVETVVLNVRHDNMAALGLYEGLGFERYCRFHEAVASEPDMTAA
jgi:ribosomal protein S18 acetylase RimI-like enzyme